MRRRVGWYQLSSTALLKSEPARCTDGRQIRDFLYVEDVAAAFVALLTSDVCGTVNIGSGEPISLRHLVTNLATIMDAPQMVEFGAFPTGRAIRPSLFRMCAGFEKNSVGIRRSRSKRGWSVPLRGGANILRQANGPSSADIENHYPEA